MSKMPAVGIGVGSLAGLDPAEYGAIHSVPSTPLLKARPDLLPAEEALSLPPPEPKDPKIALLNRALGAALTVDNPVWSGDPVPQLRALQKLLIADSLTRPQHERGAALGALKVVEQAVRLRLRWQQMRRSAAEADVDLGAEAAAPAPRQNSSQDSSQNSSQNSSQQRRRPASTSGTEQEDHDETQATAAAAG